MTDESTRPAAAGPGPRVPSGEGVHLQATASGDARVSQAGRDLHVHYGNGVRERQRTEPGSLVDVCPYPGLAAFGFEQARWFFGRDALIADLIDILHQRLDVSGGLQMVVAPSGAGKSSLLRAGLLTKLTQAALPGSDQWLTLMLTPTADPVRALADRIASLPCAESLAAGDLAADPDSCVRMLRTSLRDSNGRQSRVVVVVDQFEELFTLCGDARQRRTFIDLLARLAERSADTPAVGLVVVGVRADFYAACVNHPVLCAALQDRPLVVGPIVGRHVQ